MIDRQAQGERKGKEVNGQSVDSFGHTSKVFVHGSSSERTNIHSTLGIEEKSSLFCHPCVHNLLAAEGEMIGFLPLAIYSV